MLTPKNIGKNIQVKIENRKGQKMTDQSVKEQNGMEQNEMVIREWNGIEWTGMYLSKGKEWKRMELN